MKPLLAASLAMLIAFVVGCGKSNPSQATPATTNSAAVTTATNMAVATGQALEQYGHTMALAKRNALEKTDLISVDRAIQAFMADRGKNPDSLDELITEKFLPKLPDPPRGKKYSYNPQTGEVKIVDGP